MFTKYVLAIVGCLTLALAAVADEQGALMRQLVSAQGEAVVTIKMALKETMSMAEYGTEVSEYTQEINATVISEGGLMVTSLMQIDPASLMNAFMGDDDEVGFDSKTEVTSVKVLRGQEEIDAEIVLRDTDLDLAFLRPAKKTETPWKFTDLSTSPIVEAFDRIFVLSRMGKVVNRLTTIGEARIYGVIEKPRKVYVIGEYMGSGMPVYAETGNCLGINVTRKLDMQSNNGIGYTSGYESNMASIIIPGADILELIEQVPPYAAEKPAP